MVASEVQAGPPDFVGVGVQGAGGEWWHELLLAHPDIHGSGGRGRHFFDVFCRKEMGDEDVAAYHASFPRPEGALTGEWTSRYMYDAWTPRLLHRAAPDARLLVLLRDPVERYRFGISRQRETVDIRRKRLAATEAIERGRYATQLHRLRRFFPADRVLVLQYERCLLDPAGQYARTLRFLGVRDDVAPDLSQPPDHTVSGAPLWRDMLEALRHTFEPEVHELRALVPDLDVELWPAFAPRPVARRRFFRLAR